MHSFDVGAARVGDGRCLLIAEIAQSHDGSLGLAHAYIDAAARAGADAIKFQTHVADAESTPSEPWRVRFSPQDDSRYDYWKRMEFTEEQWAGLRRHADDAGIEFLSSPFSVAAVEMLARLGVSAWKIASGETTNPELLAAVFETRLPLLVSTGMSRLHEVEAVVDAARSAGSPIVVMQCTSMYPCPPEKVGLNNIELFAEQFECPVGLSDHSGTIFPALAARVLGAAVIEVHLTMSREMFGPDVPSSLTTAEFALMSEGVRFIETMLDHPVDKEDIANELTHMRSLFSRSIVAARDLDAGTKLARSDIALKKPGTGLPPERIDDVIGRTLQRTVSRDDLISEADLG